jgi:hypothetical protein
LFPQFPCRDNDQSLQIFLLRFYPNKVFNEDLCLAGAGGKNQQKGIAAVFPGIVEFCQRLSLMVLESEDGPLQFENRLLEKGPGIPHEPAQFQDETFTIPHSIHGPAENLETVGDQGILFEKL